MEAAWIKPKKFTKLKVSVSLAEKTPDKVVKNDGDGSPLNQELNELEKRKDSSRNLPRKRKHHCQSKAGHNNHFESEYQYKENHAKVVIIEASEEDPYDYFNKIKKMAKENTNPINGKIKAASADEHISFEKRLKILDKEKSFREQRAKPTFNLRKARECEDLTDWKKMYPLQKKKKVAEEVEQDLEDLKYSQHLGKKKLLDMARRRRGSGGPSDAAELLGPVNAPQFSPVYTEDTPKYGPNCRRLRQYETWRCKIQNGATCRLTLEKLFTPFEKKLSQKKKKEIIEDDFSSINNKALSLVNGHNAWLNVGSRVILDKKFIQSAKAGMFFKIKNLHMKSMIETLNMKGYKITNVHVDPFIR